MIDLKPNLEDCGIRMIERLTGIHNSQISSWIEGTGGTLCARKVR
ncbi:hypothetical protein [Candidatus Midichloria mitochondrii]|nr:hypothetical protein [Candidatus Midichloria mitochondrii]